MSANERQVGGSHYAADYQHWDLVCDLRLHYLLGCSTKYVARYGKKDGLVALEKALHYLDKYIEVLGDAYFTTVLSFGEVEVLLTRFFAANPHLGPRERDYFAVLAHSHDAEALQTARVILEIICREESDRSGQPRPTSDGHVPGTRAPGVLSAQDVTAYASSAEHLGTPWGHGVACVLRSLWDMRRQS